MFNSKEVFDLLPCVQLRCNSFKARAEMEVPGLKLIICSTLRDKESQDALYQIGRRGIAGERVVTNAKGGDSFHQYGVAFDVLPLIYGKSAYTLQDGDEVSDPLWQTLGRIAEEEGLEWGGRWKTFKEGPHFQYTGGLSLNELKSGAVPTE